MDEDEELSHVTNEMGGHDIVSVGRDGVTKIVFSDYGGPAAAAPVAVIWKGDKKDGVLWLGPGMRIVFQSAAAPEDVEF